MTNGATGATRRPQYSDEFRLSITKALGDQLGDAILDLTPAPLEAAVLANLDARPGVYQLYRCGELVYIGKADRSLPDRLGQHLRKISGRLNISPAEMTFTCLYVVEDLSAVAPEALLIKRFQGDGRASWNTNGFGNKDPGRQRDTTVIGASHFDAEFPIDLDARIEFSPGPRMVKQYLESLKDGLPYNLRYHKELKGRTGPSVAQVYVDRAELTAREAFELAMASLPPGWQLTALLGYAVLYKEARSYDSALAWWQREPDGRVVETLGRRLVAAGEAMVAPEAED